ncbi:hypothetical protein MW290_15680 [Aquincola tertiaricarbonis]|uniref:Stability determinant domain-containing protein n=1 Tax=Aquincola tertiaricarbonis TaxID=391953 RepID=A0ABY4SEW2_AQUTE|nr:hypothetical protein [Aquincola tertiaricarbonis]URI10452.1 hypothetical protein MW290_15680 [Aquincola tertiaricarbonis]
MPTSDKTIDHGTLRRLVDAGARVGAEVVGSGGRWEIVIRHGRTRQTLAATRGRPKSFRQFETLAGYLKDLGIVEYRVNAAEFQGGGLSTATPDRRSVAASQRMKRAHEAVAYDAWFREQVQTSIDDPRPSVGDEEARQQMAARREALLKKAGR